MLLCIQQQTTLLQATRDQITACFEKISCFGLCHPGMDVVKKTYDGSIAKIDPMFCTLLDAYARRVFGDELEPKVHTTVTSLNCSMILYRMLITVYTVSLHGRCSLFSRR
jgi:hypothetical protein